MQVVNGANRSYTQNQMIFSENEPGQDLFILQKAKVKITKIIKDNDVLLNIIKPGDIFLERWLFLITNLVPASRHCNGRC